MIHDDKEYLSQKKHNELAEELDNLRSVERKKVLAELEDAKKLGDLSENAEYHEARKKQAELEERIALIEQLLQNATIVSHRKSDTISMGSTVSFRKISGGRAGEEKTFEIVGTEEANAAQGKISNKSPIGAAIIGKKKGDTVSVKTPSGQHTEYEITEVK